MYQKESNGYLVLFFWLVFLAFGVYLFIFGTYKDVKEFSQNAEMPEEFFGFTGDYFYSFLEKIGEAGQSAYFNFQLFDYINLILLGFTLSITIRHFLIKLQTRRLFYIILIFPVLLILIDILENSLIIYLVYYLPGRYYGLAKLASDLTKLKIIFGSLAVFSLLISGIIVLFKTLYQKSNRTRI